MKILVSGANGFVGKSLCSELHHQRHTLIAAIRSASSQTDDFERVVIGAIDMDTDWTNALDNVDVVIHLAARVHVMNEAAVDPLAEFRKVNVAGTLNLALQASKAGVKRFIFISSIKVNGEHTYLGSPFNADQTPAPQDAYGTSKHEAELGLRGIAAETGMQVVIIRPPLIYGAAVKANFASLLRVVRRGVPLPLGLATYNRRSFVALDNLVNFIITCIHHPNAANQTFLVSDNDDVSTADLLRRMAAAQGVPARLIPMPLCVLKLGAKLLGKTDVAQRLLGSLQVDIIKNQVLLGWQPPFTLQQGLKLMVNGKS